MCAVANPAALSAVSRDACFSVAAGAPAYGRPTPSSPHLPKIQEHLVILPVHSTSHGTTVSERDYWDPQVEAGREVWVHLPVVSVSAGHRQLNWEVVVMAKYVAFVSATVGMLVAGVLALVERSPTIGVAASVTTFPIGVYTVEVIRADVPAAMPPLVIALQVGVWQATFEEGGRHTMSKDRRIAWGDRILSEPGQVALAGRYAATQTHVALYADEGPLGCDIKEGDARPMFPPGLPARLRSGVYEWRFDGKALTFVKVIDDCPGRAAVFPAHPWTRLR